MVPSSSGTIMKKMEGSLSMVTNHEVFQEDQKAEFRPWAIDFPTWEERYVDFYECDINSGQPNYGIYFYQVH